MAIKITKKPKGKMYECQAFFPLGYPKKWKYVRDLKSFEQFLSKSHSSWKYFNVYEKGSKQYLKRFYPGNIVPKVLGVVLLVLLTQKFTSSITLSSSLSVGLSNPMKNTSSKATSRLTASTNDFNYCATIPTQDAREKEVLCTL